MGPTGSSSSQPTTLRLPRLTVRSTGIASPRFAFYAWRITTMAENQYLPDEVSPPGETLLEVLEERGISQAELAERTGRPRKTINEIVKAKSAITPETALQLERVLGVPAHFWNSRESAYREFIARRDEHLRLEAQLYWVDRFPVREMIKRGFIPDRRPNKIALLEALLDF